MFFIENIRGSLYKDFVINYLERLFPILRKDHNLISKILFHCSTDEEKQTIAKYFSFILNSSFLIFG